VTKTKINCQAPKVVIEMAERYLATRTEKMNDMGEPNSLSPTLNIPILAIPGLLSANPHAVEFLLKSIKKLLTFSVCPYTLISLILCSIMMECRDLALNNLPSLTVGGSWDSFEPNGTGLTSQITPTPWAEPTSSESSSFINKVVINEYKTFLSS
jgi:hypothetical protein